MFCGKCGEELKPDNFFCIMCGEPADIESNKEKAAVNKIEQTIKESINNAYLVGDVLITHYKESGQDIFNDLTGKDIIKMELTLFCFYLFSFSSMEADAKAQIMRTFLDCDLDGKYHLPLIRQNVNIGGNLTTTVPFSITLMSKVDKQLGTRGCRIILDAYQKLGKAILQCDVSDSECSGATEGYENYTSMIREYIKENCGYTVSSESKKVSYEITYELGKIEYGNNGDIILCVTRYRDGKKLDISILIVLVDDEDDLIYFLQDFDSDGNILGDEKGEFSGLKLIKPTDDVFCVVDFSGIEIILSGEQYKALSEFLYSDKQDAVKDFDERD